MKKLFWLTGLLVLAAAPLAAQDDEPPAAPTNLNVTRDYDGAVAVANLSWRDESDDETGFEVLRSDNAGEYRVVGFVGANTTNYQDRVGKYMTGSFAYKVRAFKGKLKSGESNVAAVWF